MTEEIPILKAPFPWFGGKSRAAHLVWPRLGDVPNYVEPFYGSGAILLNRPHLPRTETINDMDCYVANFWRAISLAPDEVAHYADKPINEADLHAWHRWLVNQADWRKKMMDGENPDFFDAKVAGRWVWGLSMWIGSGWCSRPEWIGRGHAARAPRGIAAEGKRPRLTGFGETGVHALAPGGKRPDLKRGGSGVQGQKITLRRGVGMGVNADNPGGQLPALGGCDNASGSGIFAKRNRNRLTEYFDQLAARLRRVRVCCGDWSRVVTPSPTWKIGLTGVLLDPPYADTAQRTKALYNEDSLTIAHAVREWAILNGHNPLMRIALCGYQGEHDMPADWECVAWKANGGYASAAGNHANANRERIWFSPNCLKPENEPELFRA